MVGRKMADIYPKEDVEIGEPLLEVRGFCQPGLFQDIDFTVHKGEILGSAGLIGAGRTEIMRAVFGVDPYQAGELYMHGQRIKNKNSVHAVANKFSMVTEDRLRCGVLHILSVKMNASLAYLRCVVKGGFVNRKQEETDVLDMTEKLSVKMPGIETEIGQLSGGNQQKVIIAKWLLTQPEILILDEPTRGIDVGAKAEIYKIIGELAKQGKAIIMVSSELPELMGISDRIIVIHEGKIFGEFKRNEFNQDAIMTSAFGVSRGTSV
jgi:inositol transport system ATP-binding protein